MHYDSLFTLQRIFIPTIWEKVHSCVWVSHNEHDAFSFSHKDHEGRQKMPVVFTAAKKMPSNDVSFLSRALYMTCAVSIGFLWQCYVIEELLATGILTRYSAWSLGHREPLLLVLCPLLSAPCSLLHAGMWLDRTSNVSPRAKYVCTIYIYI